MTRPHFLFILFPLLLDFVLCLSNVTPYSRRNKRSDNYPYYEELLKAENTNLHKRYGIQTHSIKKRQPPGFNQPRLGNQRPLGSQQRNFPPQGNIASESEIPSFKQYNFNDMETAIAQTLYILARTQLRRSMEARLNEIVHNYMQKADQEFKQNQQQSPQLHQPLPQYPPQIQQTHPSIAPPPSVVYDSQSEEDDSPLLDSTDVEDYPEVHRKLVLKEWS